jgi:hypothetical protein
MMNTIMETHELEGRNVISILESVDVQSCELPVV